LILITRKVKNKSKLIFWNENKELVRVKVKDTLDSKKLGYGFQDAPVPWLKIRPPPKLSRQEKSRRAAEKSVVLTPISAFPVVLDKVISVEVSRPRKSRSATGKEDEDEVLVIEGIEYEENQLSSMSSATMNLIHLVDQTSPVVILLPLIVSRLSLLLIDHAADEGGYALIFFSLFFLNPFLFLC
jgi:hypothetical protein